MGVRSTMKILLPRALSFSRKRVFFFVLINRESWIRQLSLIRNTWSIIRHVAHRRSIRQSLMRDYAPSPPLRIRPVGNVAVKQSPPAALPLDGTRIRGVTKEDVRRTPIRGTLNVFTASCLRRREKCGALQYRRWPFLARSINGICLDRCGDAFTKIDLGLF